MHYTGMAAMRMSAHLSYEPYLVGVSVLIAIGASIAALWLGFRTAAQWQRLLAAVVMGMAISGMHYTGMTAAVFTAHSARFSRPTARPTTISTPPAWPTRIWPWPLPA
jgi:NO-binding membrane sensor protein with MHYT domain